MNMTSTANKMTVDEYYTMIRSGILHEDDRVELLEGEIVEMSPISKAHAGVVNKLSDILIGSLREKAIISVQNPVLLSELSEPQPDVALLKFRRDFYVDSLPTADDIFF